MKITRDMNLVELAHEMGGAYLQECETMRDYLTVCNLIPNHIEDTLDIRLDRWNEFVLKARETNFPTRRQITELLHFGWENLNCVERKHFQISQNPSSDIHDVLYKRSNSSLQEVLRLLRIAFKQGWVQ